MFLYCVTRRDREGTQKMGSLILRGGLRAAGELGWLVLVPYVGADGVLQGAEPVVDDALVVVLYEELHGVLAF